MFDGRIDNFKPVRFQQVQAPGLLELPRPYHLSCTGIVPPLDTALASSQLY